MIFQLFQLFQYLLKIAEPQVKMRSSTSPIFFSPSL